MTSDRDLGPTWFAQFFENSPSLVCMVKADGTVVAMNPSLLALLGLPEELTSFPFTDVVHPDDIDRATEHLRVVFEGDSPSVALVRVRTQEGGWVTIESRGGKVLEQKGSQTAAVFILRDASQDVATNTEPYESASSGLGADFDADKFMSHVGHELRTPLNSVLGLTQLLQMELDDPHHVELADDILKAGHRLLGLIDGAVATPDHQSSVATASVENGRFDPIDPPGATLLYIDDNDANIALVERLMALRPNVQLFTSSRGEPGIAMAKQYRPDLILLDVHLPDLTGYEVLQLLRADPATSDIPIVMLSADATEWQINRFRDAGSNDYLTKPLDLKRLLSVLDVHFANGRDPASEQADASSQSGEPVVVRATTPARARPVKLRNATLLYIEDAVANIQLVERLLLRVPEVHLITSQLGSLGVELAQQHLPDLILLDAWLPDLHGLHVLRLLRDDPRTAAIPVVMLSADVDVRQISRLRAAGANDYLTKPFDLHQLLRILEEYLGEVDLPTS